MLLIVIVYIIIYIYWIIDQKILDGVESYSYYGTNKYINVILQSNNNNGEYKPAAPLLMDYFEPERTIGRTYITTNGKKKIIGFDSKTNKFLVRGENSPLEEYNYYIFII